MIIDFWCEKHGDMTLDGHLCQNSRVPYKIYEAKCPKCWDKYLRREVGNPNDPYYRNSPKIRRQIKEQVKDLVQPSDPKFQTLYKKEWDKIQEQRAKEELRLVEEKKRKDALYDRYKHDIEKRELLNKYL
jgi:glycyl-tRNA synthetase alpha subunit